MRLLIDNARVWDGTGAAAFPGKVLIDGERIASVAAAQSAERIIIGLPLRLDGSRGPEAAAAERLAAGVRKAAGLPVQMVDERLTTAAAERSLIEGGVRREKRRASIDRVAAVILLQGHLDGLRRSKRAG